jgi:hypothetical protein
MNNLKLLGFWSGLGSAVFSIIYSLFQILTVAGCMTTPWEYFWMFLPSELLSVSFVILMCCLYFYAKDEMKLWAMIGLVFGIIYAVLVNIVYFVELSVVIPAILSGQSGKVELLLPGPNSFMISLDALGYAFMSLSTLFAYKIFKGGVLEKWIGWSMLANGALAPVILLALFYPVMMIFGALWMITVPLSMVLITILFYRMK